MSHRLRRYRWILLFCSVLRDQGALGRRGRVSGPTEDVWELHSGHVLSESLNSSQLTAGCDPVAAVLDQAANLNARYLFDGTGLSPTDGLVLNQLERNGPARVTALASAEGISQPWATKVVQRLVGRGLVAKLSDPQDRRAALLSITESGRALLAQRTQTRRRRLAELSAGLSADDRIALRHAAQVALPFLSMLKETANAQANTSDSSPDTTRRAGQEDGYA